MALRNGNIDTVEEILPIDGVVTVFFLEIHGDFFEKMLPIRRYIAVVYQLGAVQGSVVGLKVKIVGRSFIISATRCSMVPLLSLFLPCTDRSK